MEIKVYMKNGLLMDMYYDEDMLEAFKNDERALETMEDMMLHAHFITLDNLKRDVTIRMDEIVAYEVIR
ncbi:hypothetical protein [Exiguobacterium sp. s21]|uniref:hypothetical protein n=1 Tax=Exiguobacterium sp. s21 TaxID=2751244 RepID=UPI001BE6CBB0|nr:hypothetical protein [Exiguobacterium sp. s21]